MTQEFSREADPTAFKYRARELAYEFSETFDKAYGKPGIEDAVRAQCSGQ